MIYTLWDLETNNLVAEYESLDEALARLQRGIERNGPNDPDSLSLEAEDEVGAGHLTAYGRDLADLTRDRTKCGP